MRLILTLAVFSLALSLFPTARADWVEVGDAGELISTAQETGTGTLTYISGETNIDLNNDWVDAYVIKIVDPANFSATLCMNTLEHNPVGYVGYNMGWRFDTRLFLFDLNGNGLLANDTCHCEWLYQSTITDPGIWPGGKHNNPQPLTAGTYVLAVTCNDNLCQDSNMNDIFEGWAYQYHWYDLCGPVPGALTLAKWRNDPNHYYEYADYIIALTGCEGGSAALTSDVNQISCATGGAVNFYLDAGTSNAGKLYLMLGSVSGTGGFTLPGGAIMPLDWDVFTDLVIAMLNTPVFSMFTANLDGTGKGTAVFDTLGPVTPAYPGLDMYYAFCLKPFGFVSNPVTITLVP